MTRPSRVNEVAIEDSTPHVGSSNLDERTSPPTAPNIIATGISHDILPILPSSDAKQNATCDRIAPIPAAGRNPRIADTVTHVSSSELSFPRIGPRVGTKRFRRGAMCSPTTMLAIVARIARGNELGNREFRLANMARKYEPIPVEIKNTSRWIIQTSCPGPSICLLRRVKAMNKIAPADVTITQAKNFR